MQVLCGLQVVFFLFNCQTPAEKASPRKRERGFCLEFFALADKEICGPDRLSGTEKTC